MKLGPTLVTLLSGLCISAAVASAQSAICGGDGEANTTAAPVACVTGAGVQVAAAPAAGEKSEAPALAPEQRPADVPNVTYINGKLRVVAKNAILSDILKAIAAKTGAAIEVPEGANERVVSQLGPAPARDVIAALLNGSHYNYVMVGTEADSEVVARVIVTAKTEKADTGTAVAAGGRPAMMQPRNALQAAVMQPYQEMLQQQQAQQAAAQELQAQITSEITEQGGQGVNNDAPAAAPGVAPAPAGAPDAGSASTPAEAPPAEAPRAGSAGTDKTPQQMLQDLYETRRQMMQQQHQPQPNQ
jgi:hypothetical protein